MSSPADPGIEEMLEVQELLGLPRITLVEKDFHMVRALSALASIDVEGVTLVFGGGTALCRAHGLIHRMSEDIDLKIDRPTGATKGQRKAFRKVAADRLLEAGFEFDPDDLKQCPVYDDYRMLVFNLPYPAITPQLASLRSQIKIELSSWPIFRETVSLPVRSFVAEAYARAPEVGSVRCVSVLESAAEKFVALTRRVAEARMKHRAFDRTLVRHVHDLHRLAATISLPEFAALVDEVMAQEREGYGARFPEYRADPTATSVLAIVVLRSDATYRQYYEDFQQEMVYGAEVDWDEALETLDSMAAAVSHRG